MSYLIWSCLRWWGSNRLSLVHFSLLESELVWEHLVPWAEGGEGVVLTYRLLELLWRGLLHCNVWFSFAFRCSS